MEWLKKIREKLKNRKIDKNKKDKKLSSEDNFGYVLLIGVGTIVVILIDMFYMVFNYNIFAFTSTIGGLICSLIIVYSILFIVFGITNKSTLSISIVTAIVVAVSIINQIKISYMSEPVYLSDVKYLKNIGEIFKMVDSTFLFTVKQYIPSTIIIISVVVLLIYILIKKGTNVRIKNRRNRVLVILIPLAIILLLFFPNKITKKLYLNLFYNADDRKNYDYFVSTMEYYSRYGVIAGIYGQFLEGQIFEPNEYDENHLANTLESVARENESELSMGKPNIIVILSESFWDISKLDEIEFDKQVTPNFSKLKDQGILFEMISPSYGGTTANVEMELLTGFNLAYYNNGYMPYLQLYDSTIKARPSIIEELNNNGYTTKITSCTSEQFFNRNEVYTNFGTDQKIYLNNVSYENYKGQYLSDEYLTNQIINELETKGENEKLFSMTLTIQQHMPYVYEKYDEYDIQIVSSNLDEQMEETVLAYAQGVYDADKELGRLNKYIQKFDEPTIIVFFGDHLPYLNTSEGKSVMDKLSYFNTENKLLNNYRKYNTEALVISNYDIKEERIKYLGPDLLMAYLLNRMDLELSDYYIWLDDTKNILPSYNSSVAIDKHGKLYETKKLLGDMNNQYLLREKMQYMLYLK
ncbi:MAG: LTA synthase family protein [Clostridia bacterium]|nr:LTA synthase family protein [Clostridia bacterium]